MIIKIFGLFLIAHGLVHSGLAAAPNPYDSDPKPGTFFTATTRNWLLPKLGFQDAVVQWVGIVLVALTTIGFIVAGLGGLGVSGISTIWRTVAIASSYVSLLLLILFWHPWLVVGVLIDIGVLVSLLWANWPPESLIG
jgi:hypothetical protein